MTETQTEILAAEVALVKAEVAVLKAKASADFAKVKTYIVGNFPHFVTWAGVAALAVKLGALKLV